MLCVSLISFLYSFRYLMDDGRIHEFLKGGRIQEFLKGGGGQLHAHVSPESAKP